MLQENRWPSKGVVRDCEGQCESDVMNRTLGKDRDLGPKQQARHRSAILGER